MFDRIMNILNKFPLVSISIKVTLVSRRKIVLRNKFLMKDLAFSDEDIPTKIIKNEFFY